MSIDYNNVLENARMEGFIRLPERFVEELAQVEPTGVIHGDTWHEVQFEMGGIMCQCAVVNGAYVALDHGTVNQFTRIIKVLK